MGKRILLATTGSYGDLHPYLAIGLGLEARGHAVTIATSNLYREKVLRTGLGFAPMGPHFDALSPELARKLFHPLKGPEILVRRILYPSVPEVYRELMPALAGMDLIFTHPITFAAQIAAEKTGIPWISTVTAPLSIVSKYDPPVFAAGQWLGKLRGFGPGVNGAILSLAHAAIAHWRKPIAAFRASIGLPPGADPIFEGQHSPECVLAMFSRLMAQPQPDWPKQARVIGFPFYDQAEHGQTLDPELERFLDAGPAPVVFTLGSSAVLTAGSFYRESLEAVRRLGCRAVLLVGRNAIREPLPPGAAAFAYAPYSQLLPRAACVVHQGGIGTCGQTLAAGRPMLIVPFAWDQPDNAVRLERLVVARSISRSRYTGRRAAAEIERLLSDASYGKRAAEAACQIAAEDAVGAACDAVG